MQSEIPCCLQHLLKDSTEEPERSGESEAGLPCPERARAERRWWSEPGGSQSVHKRDRDADRVCRTETGGWGQALGGQTVRTS